MLSRVPAYISYLEKLCDNGVPFVSSTQVARELGLGDVQVRKELSQISGTGRPRVGYQTEKLLCDLRSFLGKDEPCEAVIVGAGKLGMALLGYSSFADVGVLVKRAFDVCPNADMGVRPVEELTDYCKENNVKIGIITVPEDAAQQVCDTMIGAGIAAIWNFAPTELSVPEEITVINEKLAISLSVLRAGV